VDIDDGSESENFSLLHYACYQGNAVVVKILLEKKLNVNAMVIVNIYIYISMLNSYIVIAYFVKFFFLF
jgi:ankyrin repeat protein